MTSELSSAAQAERQADALRADLAATIDQLAGNLHPKRLATEAMATTRAHTPDWLARTLGFLASPSGLTLVGATTAAVVTTLGQRRRRV